MLAFCQVIVDKFFSQFLVSIKNTGHSIFMFLLFKADWQNNSKSSCDPGPYYFSCIINSRGKKFTRIENKDEEGGHPLFFTKFYDQNYDWGALAIDRQLLKL